ncbi:MAG: nucleoside-diphosphate kinase [Chlamydiota bacterium]
MKKWMMIFSMACSLLSAKEARPVEASVATPQQKTFSMIKPDAVAANKIGHIVARIEDEGFHVVAMKMTTLSKEEASSFYSVHKERPFFNELVDYITSGPVVAMVVEKNNAVENYRKLMGATDPLKAAPGTLRGDFGKSIDKNAVHGSDSIENADIEIAFFFSDNQVQDRR